MDRLPALALLLAWPAAAAELSAHLTVAPDLVAENPDSPYHVAAPAARPPRQQSRQDLQLSLRQGGFNAQAILRTEVAEGQRSETRAIASQWYYDGDLGGGLGWTAGRKVLSWGVGFGFKPLDVIQREDRRRINPPPPVGVPVLAIEQFTATDAWTLAWAAPGAGGATDPRDPSLALHGYRVTAGGNDIHGVARLSARRRFEAGVGGTVVAGDEWSFHGALLYQRRSRPRLNGLIAADGLFATEDPMAEAPRRHGLKAVAGSQWTGASGWGMLLEAWYDGDAYSRAQWRQLEALTARQRALASRVPTAAVEGNVAWSSQAYQAVNLLRENLLLRLSHDDGDGLRCHGDLQLTPVDRGWVATLGASFTGDRQRLSAGLRQLGGSPGSATALAPLRRMLWAEWRLSLF